MIHKRHFFNVLGFLQPILISLVAFRDILFSQGIVMHGDILFPLNAWSWVTVQSYTWDKWIGQLSVHLPKIPIMILTIFPALTMGLSSELSEKLWIVFVYAFTGIAVFFSIFILLDRKDQNIYNLKNLLICSIPSLFIQFNPWSTLQITEHPWFVLSLSAMIFLICLLFKILRNSNGPMLLKSSSLVKYSIATSVLIGLIATTPQFIIYTIILVALVLLYNFKSFLKSKRELGLVLLISGLINMYWILPYSYYSLLPNGTSAISPSNSPVDTSPKALSSLSKNSQILNVTNLNSNWDPDIPYDFNNYFLDSLWVLTGIFIIYFAFSFFLRGSERFKDRYHFYIIQKDYLFFIFILLLAIFLAQGTQGPLPKLYIGLVKIHSLGWMFRDPYKFDGLIVLSLIFIFSFILNNMIKSNNIRGLYKGILIITLIFSVCFHNWVILTGNFNSRFVSLLPPKDYLEDVNYLKAQDSKGIVLWFPNFGGAYIWDTTKYWSGKDIGKLSTYNPVFVRNPTTAPFYDYIFYSLVKLHKTRDIGELLQAVGVKYLVIHSDYHKNAQLKKIESELMLNHDLSVVKKTNYTTIFENHGKSDLFSIRTKNLLVYNHDLTALNPLFGNYDLSAASIIFSNESNVGVPMDYVYTQNKNLTPTPYYYSHQNISKSKEASAQVVDYKAIDPTKYIINVNASHPYMLVFAQAYDPLWVAKVKENEQGKTAEYKSIPLYSVVNGFWINKTGQYQVEITYKPQELYYIGATISVATLVFFLSYLIYQYRKKDDEPSQKLQ